MCYSSPLCNLQQTLSSSNAMVIIIRPVNYLVHATFQRTSTWPGPSSAVVFRALGLSVLLTTVTELPVLPSRPNHTLESLFCRPTTRHYLPYKQKSLDGPLPNWKIAKMQAMQSAMAVKRARQKRTSRSGAPGQPPPVIITRDQLTPPKQNSSLSYFNVGAAFILIGTFMLATSLMPDDILGPNWTSLVPVGCLLIALGVIMVTINQIKEKREEAQLESYVRQRLGKSMSGNPLVRSPTSEIINNQLSVPRELTTPLLSPTSESNHQLTVPEEVTAPLVRSPTTESTNLLTIPEMQSVWTRVVFALDAHWEKWHHLWSLFWVPVCYF